MNFKTFPKSTIKTLMVLLFSLAAMPGWAATLNVSYDGELLGASGVEISGTSYNVKFVNGSCIGVFERCSTSFGANDGSNNGIVFDTLELAQTASSALGSQVFIQSDLGDFRQSFRVHTRYALEKRCVLNGFSCNFHDLVFTTFSDYVAPITRDSCTIFPSGQFCFPVLLAPGFDRTLTTSFRSTLSSTFAVWSIEPIVIVPDPVVPAVPLPAGGLLLLTGLAAVAAFRRRTQRAG